MSTDTPQRPQEAPQGLRRWEEVIFPAYRIQEPSRPSGEATQRTPAWVKRMGLNAKDLTNG